jgi:hypothetical protein
MPKPPSNLAALLGLVAASLPMELDPAVHNIAIVAAGNALHMDGADRALAASIGTLCIAAFILTTGALGDRLGRNASCCSAWSSAWRAASSRRSPPAA